MKKFEYYHPTEILFGRGRLEEIADVVLRHGRRCLLVTVPPCPELTPLFEKVKAFLEAGRVPTAHFAGVVANPTTEVVAAGAAKAREFGADVVLGVGGGSSMDTAKAVAVEASHDGGCWDYLFFRDKQPTEKTLPVVAVTTTAGTGSHVTQVAVVTHTAERTKSALYHPRLYPRTGLVDPELTRTVPPRVTAVTGFDVLSHAFESYLNPKASAYTDLMAVEALRLVAANLPRAVKDGSDMAARTAMSWADTLAGLCIANAGVTLPHGIGMAMGGMYPHVAHGEALAAVYPAVLRYSWESAVDRFAVLAGILDSSFSDGKAAAAAEAASDAVAAFLEKIGLRVDLDALGIPKEEIEELARASLVLPDYKNHPRVATENDVHEILENCRGKL